MDTETTNDSVNRGVLYGFVPCRLEIEARPELYDFPLNVMFMQFKTENGKLISGTALYEPDFGSYKKESDVSSMEYRNKYGLSNWLVIEYDSAGKRYSGRKFIEGKLVGITDGNTWNMFFIHFTMLGLSDGERCRFEDVTRKTN